MAHLGKYHFTMRKSYGVMIFWFLFFGYPNMFLLRDWLDGNILGLFIALLLWSPAFYMLADCIRSRINVYEKGLVYQSLFRRKVVEFTPRLQMYIVRFLEQKYFGWKTVRYISIRFKQNQEVIKIPISFLNLGKLADELLQYQQQFMLPVMEHAFRNGKTQNFGVVELNAKWIASRDKKIPLSLLRKIKINNGYLEIYTDLHTGHKLYKATKYAVLTDIANLDILLDLLDVPKDNLEEEFIIVWENF